jgi:glutamine synthetase
MEGIQMAIQAEYLWIDGSEPTQLLRSKTKVLPGPVSSLEDLPIWGFDGSSTSQAPGDESDCVLKPVFYIPDPIRGGDNVIVLNEVWTVDDEPHPSNTRAKTREIAEKYGHHEPWFGIEQEYTFMEDGRPHGWPVGGYPAPQGGYYCGVGADEIWGRPVVEAHTQACMDAGIAISGTNAEVMMGQWEFQVGPLGPLEVSDQIWVARWLLYRIAEDFDISATLDPKPVKGDWNGAGAHTNFSTKAMRESYEPVVAAAEALGKRHDQHITNYGVGVEKRLTGLHETAPWTEFSYGVSNRGASVRIPWQVAKEGKGYLEDRRPNANMDPYVVTALMTETICGSADGDL